MFICVIILRDKLSMVFIMFIEIIASLAILGAAPEKGWVSVERPHQTTEQQSLVNSSKENWPVFVRHFGVDKVLIRFPNEPSYDYPYVERGDLETMQISSTTSESAHSLFVGKRSGEDLEAFATKRKESFDAKEGAFVVSFEKIEERIFDLFYRNEERWVRERILVSPDRFYVLQTVTETVSEDLHRKFFASFDLEMRDGNQSFHREFQSKN